MRQVRIQACSLKSPTPKEDLRWCSPLLYAEALLSETTEIDLPQS